MHSLILMMHSLILHFQHVLQSNQMQTGPSYGDTGGLLRSRSVSPVVISTVLPSRGR